MPAVNRREENRLCSNVVVAYTRCLDVAKLTHDFLILCRVAAVDVVVVGVVGETENFCTVFG